MARIRKLLSFDPDVESHRKAMEILEQHGGSSDFMVECILHYESMLTKEDLQQEIKHLTDLLSGISFSHPADPEKDSEENQESKREIDQIPDQLFDIMKII